MKAKTPQIPFSKKTLPFLKTAGKQTRLDWLEKNQKAYQDYLLNPFISFAKTIKEDLGPLAPDYHFPQRGLGRIKRSPFSRSQNKGEVFKNWISYSAARPRTSRFEHQPNLFFLINTEDAQDPVLVAGGLYMPSSKQLREIRTSISKDAGPFRELFESKSFRASFKKGFSSEKTSSRIPRGFDPNHPELEWLKLQAFFVWKPYPKSTFTSKTFANTVAKDFKQILRLNRLLERVLDRADSTTVISNSRKHPKRLNDRLDDVNASRPAFDF